MSLNPDVWSPGPLHILRDYRSETAGSPMSPGNPSCLCPALRPRSNRNISPLTISWCCPCQDEDRDFNVRIFRGSITRLQHSLFIRQLADHHLWWLCIPIAIGTFPAGGYLYRVRLFTYRVPLKGFKELTYSPFRNLSWRDIFHLNNQLMTRGAQRQTNDYRMTLLFCAMHDPEPPILNFKTAVCSVSVCQSCKTLE